MNKFHEVTARLEQALEGIAYDKLDISDEVKEQVRNKIISSSYFEFTVSRHGTCMLGDNTSSV